MGPNKLSADSTVIAILGWTAFALFVGLVGWMAYLALMVWHIIPLALSSGCLAFWAFVRMTRKAWG